MRDRRASRTSVATAPPAGGAAAADGPFTVRQDVLIGRALLRVPLQLHDPICQVLALVRLDRPLGRRAPAEANDGQ
jgi:hypothetical protein